jgi:hypothetical protein
MSAHPGAVHDFAEQAKAFVAWCDSAHAGKSAETMQLEALQNLSQVYAAAMRLPGVDFHPAPEPPVQTKDERERLATNLRPLPFQYYWEVFTPTDLEGDKEPVCGDLFDDFLDIYADLSSGLWLYARKHVETAVFMWSQMFGIHWGRHAVSAMHALHSFATKEERDAS